MVDHDLELASGEATNRVWFKTKGGDSASGLSLHPPKAKAEQPYPLPIKDLVLNRR